MTVRVVTDSVSDIPAAVAEELGITVVPLNVVFGSEIYRDGIELTTEEFYHKLECSEKLPTTSTPPLQTFMETYEHLGREADGILVITISRSLSATGESALKAVEAINGNSRVVVRVVDSQFAMMAEGLLVIAAAKAAKAGATLDELVQLTERNVSRVGIRIAFDTLEYLKRGGRIGKAKALLGSMLKLHPILGIKEGEVFPYGQERSRARALDRLYDFAAGYSRIETLAVEDATTPDEAEMLVERLSALCSREHIYHTKVSPVIGTNVGPRAMGVSVLGDK